MDIEEIEHRIAHRAMLAGDADPRIDSLGAGELADQRRDLDRLRPRAENREDLHVTFHGG
jgi:hypothetical protein